MDEQLNQIILLTSVSFFLVIITYLLIIVFNKKNIAYSKQRGKKVKSILENNGEYQEFERIYQNLKELDISDIEKNRKKIKFKLIISGILVYIAIIIMSIIEELEMYKSTNLNVCLLISLGLGIVLSFWNQNDKKDFVNLYKETIISNLIKQIDNKLNYIHGRNLTNDEKYVNYYKDSEFKMSKYAIITTEDYIEGTTRNNIPLEIAEIQIGIDSKNSKPSFAGIIGHVKTNKSFNETIKIVKKNKFINKVSESDEKFFELFDVSAEDMEYAKSELNISFMNALNYFCEKYDIKFEMTLKNNDIYVRIFTEKIFEPSIKKNVLNEDMLCWDYSMLKFVIDILTRVKMIVE